MKIDIFNTDKKYNIIYADPPWTYKDKGCNGNAFEHYSLIKDSEIHDLPVNRVKVGTVGEMRFEQ